MSLVPVGTRGTLPARQSPRGFDDPRPVSCSAAQYDVRGTCGGVAGLWGLRLFTPAVPALSALAGVGTDQLQGRIRNWMAGALLALGFIWALPGALTDILGGYGQLGDGNVWQLAAYPPYGAWQFLEHWRPVSPTRSQWRRRPLDQARSTQRESGRCSFRSCLARHRRRSVHPQLASPCSRPDSDRMTGCATVVTTMTPAARSAIVVALLSIVLVGEAFWFARRHSITYDETIYLNLSLQSIRNRQLDPEFMRLGCRSAPASVHVCGTAAGQRRPPRDRRCRPRVLPIRS